MTEEEISFIKGIPLKTLDDIRYDIIPIEAYTKATERKERRIEKLEKENAELKKSLEKIQWHDLRKNPEDLPPASKGDDAYSKVVLSDDGDKVYCSLLFGTWYNYHTDRVAEVIAWTERPRFEEE